MIDFAQAQPMPFAQQTLLDQRRELDTPLLGRPELQDQLNSIHN